MTLAGFAALALLGPVLAPHDPHQADFLNRLAQPSWGYPLGTDHLGRCVLSRLLHGARLTLGAALVVVAGAVAVGTVLGLISGFARGTADHVLMRTVEGVSALPALVVSLIIAGTLGLDLPAVMAALVLVHWTEYARVVRNATVVECGKDYIRAAHAIGARRRRILFRHLLPNLFAPVSVLISYSLSWVVLSFAGLSFLGLGVEPGTPEWGSMIAEARHHMRSHPILIAAPGLAIVFSVIAVNLAGDASGGFSARRTACKPARPGAPSTSSQP